MALKSLKNFIFKDRKWERSFSKTYTLYVTWDIFHFLKSIFLKSCSLSLLSDKHKCLEIFETIL